jgi:hypothetical protein
MTTFLSKFPLYSRSARMVGLPNKEPVNEFPFNGSPA